MQLNEILEENSVKAISKKTNISENNLESLFAGEFEQLKKVKALGFISIIEREYKADLGALREQALAYYTEANDESITLGLPIMEEKKGKSKLFLLFVLLLLGYASWYLFTQFDKKELNNLLPFIEEKTIQAILPSEVNNSSELSIENVIPPAAEGTTVEKKATEYTENNHTSE